MTLTKTSLLGLIGLIVALAQINGALVGLNPYIPMAFLSVATIIVYNFFPTDNDETGGIVINIMSIAGAIVGIAGFFMDNPDMKVINGVETPVYILPVAVLSAIKDSVNTLIRFMQSSKSAQAK